VKRTAFFVKRIAFFVKRIWFLVKGIWFFVKRIVFFMKRIAFFAKRTAFSCFWISISTGGREGMTRRFLFKRADFVRMTRHFLEVDSPWPQVAGSYSK